MVAPVGSVVGNIAKRVGKIAPRPQSPTFKKEKKRIENTVKNS